MITVVFATRNGERTLPGVFEAYCRLIPPEGGWKIIAVDNASTDGSREIISSFLERLPLTYLYEGKPGKNAALNTAIPQIEGDLAVFTDDDVFPRPEWLINMRAAADSQPTYTIFGGAILPRWEIPVPDWIREWVQLDTVFALTDSGLSGGPVSHDKIFGPNMAVRAEVFRNGFRFDVSIGPRGSSYAQGSETEFVRRLGRQSCMAWHVPDAVVEHFIRRFQMRKSWVLGRAIRFGRGQYRLEHAAPSIPTVLWFGAPRYLFRQVLEQTAILLKCMLRLDKKSIFHARWILNYYRGNLIEARLMNKRTGCG